MNNPSADVSNSVSGGDKRLTAGLLLLGIALVIYLFFDGLVEMERLWATKDEYSHGYMIPLVALFIFWKKLPDLVALEWRPTWWAVVFMLLALMGLMLGELSSLFIIVNYSFLLALAAFGAAVYGTAGLRLTWAALVYLAFMIPLPQFLYQGLSAALQLISTDIGVAVIRLFDIGVFVEGNVIDLGIYKLQVVEACSGLRYLFPLMSFGFLIAYLYRGPLWHRALIFLSTIPITVLMNSFRIGVIGVTVEFWGIEMAEGFLHDFEGWFVFMACIGVLLVEIWLLNILNKSNEGLIDRIDLAYPTGAEVFNVQPGSRNTRNTLLASVALLLVILPVSILIADREELIPERDTFIQFPLIKGDWIGREGSLEDDVLDVLLLTDYIIADYRQIDDPLPVNFYVAFYESQRKGASIHSPRACLPGGGWQITELSQPSMEGVVGQSGAKVNRVVIQMDEHKQLVYYWFQQRGRIITNEYLAKWYLFWDGLTMSRSDGALVRIITPVPPGTDMADADAKLQGFLKDFYPVLPSYLPGGFDS